MNLLINQKDHELYHKLVVLLYSIACFLSFTGCKFGLQTVIYEIFYANRHLY